MITILKQICYYGNLLVNQCRMFKNEQNDKSMKVIISYVKECLIRGQ